MANASEWWRGCVIYQVYPRSFYDANGDGVGDLKGVAEKIPYIASLGVDVMWLSPFCASPMRDFGYDISDFRAVDPLFGTLDDFDLVVRTAHSHGLKVVMDQVISHTADIHPWFVESRRSRDNPRADWYVWADPSPDGCPPNNWLSNFGGPAWQWEARRRQYYLHNFLVSQPDLNFHNPEVRLEMLDVLRFWLDRGVDGFRLDTVNYYFHDSELRSNPSLPPGVVFATAPLSNPYSYQDHIFDKTRPENLDFLGELRALSDSYPGSALVGELGVDGPTVGPTLAQYTERDLRLHMAYVFELLTGEFSAAHIRAVAERIHMEIASGWICWSMGNHDVARVVSRWGLEGRARKAAPLLMAVLLSLRGSACVYGGDELGLTEADIPLERIQDPYGREFWPEYKGRDGCRTPMPWSREGAGAGFTSADDSWLPIPADHRALAVDAQDGDPGSILSRCRNFIKWRKTVSPLVNGQIAFEDAPENVLLFRRDDPTKEVLAAFNLGDEPVRFAIPPLPWKPLEGHGFNGRLLDGHIVELNGFDAGFWER